MESAGVFHKGIIWINFDAAKDPMQPLQLDNLIPNREYNLTIKYEEQAITSTKFTTQKEDRTLTVLELEPYEKSVDMVGNLTGTISETSKACVHMYFREKGKKLWGLGEHTAWSFSEPGRFYMKIDKLKENTIYEYRIGMANSAGTTAEFLTQVKEGEIRTKGETEIQIKDYVIAKEGQSGVPEIVTGSVSCYEDDSLSGYGLYGRTSDGALIKLENVTLSVEKSLVANWNTSKLTAESRLRANSAGTTEVYFEYQGIRAVMNIIVLRKTKAFGLIGVTTNREEYPAILGEDGTYEVALKEGVGYKILGEFLPKQTFDASLFTWTSSDTKIATVDQGMVAPKAAGKVTITATAVDKNAGYIQNSSTIDLVIKKVPETGEDVPSVYAVINTKKNMVLEDVAFPKEWGEGWKWKNPKTVLYALPTNTGGYLFEACYTGEDMYSYEGNVNVYISQVDSVGAYEVDGTHNGILEVSEESAGWKDTLYLKVSETHMGKLPANYRLKLPEVEGLSVIYDKVKDRYAVTAKEAGNYVLTPVMEFFEINEKTGETYVAATIAGKYSLQAVKDKQVANIQIVSEDPSVIVEEDGGLIRLNFTEELKDKKITLSAIVTDKNANQISTPLIWTTSDESVVAVAYDKKASHQATITIKGMGHALVKVTASDAAKCEAKLNVEIRDYKPRINTNKTTVNLAYDYRENGGKKIAYDNYGAVELTEVYGRRIKSVGLKNADGREETRFVISEYTLQQGKREYIILPAKEDIPKTKYNSQLEVTIEGEDETYVYPLEITVVDKMPKVTAKMGTKINLFYLTRKGDIVLKTDSNAVIKKVSWIDSSTHEGGFEIESSVSWDNKVKGYKTSVSHNDVKVKNRKLTDTSLAKGTLMVELEGVKNPIIFKNFKIGYQYKKPTLKAVSSTTNIATLTGNTTARFTIYDSLNKETLNYDKEGKQSCHYNELAYSSNSVQAAPEGSNVYTRYFGQKTQETVSYTLNSDAWREPLAVKQTIKVVQPKAKLERSTLIYNKVYPGTETTAVLIGNISSLEEASWMDIEVVGDKKSKVLVEKDILDITRTESADSPIAITLNRTKLLELEEEQDLKEGSYNFKVTPYYRDLSSGKKAKLNTLSLKIKIVDKPITVKVTAKGNLDLTKSFLLSSKDNAVYLQTKFSNIGNNYKIIGAELRGEYSRYFKLIRKSESQDNSKDYYLQIAEYGKVKAGQNYKLSVVYKLQNAGGDIIKVESNVFCIKPKQSVPPITVSGNNQTLYAASDLTREYTISVPDSYVIEKVSGGLDCNKDGKTDIAVEIASVHGNAAVVKVYLKDAYAVVATTKGKSYNIPFQVQLLGRDGLSKDVKVTGKVQVRR